MYKPNTELGTTLAVNQSTTGEPIEAAVERLTREKEPMDTELTPLIYTPRSEGVRASTNIRTDRFEVAIEATDVIAKSYKARREERSKLEAEAKLAEEKAAETQPKTPPPQPEGKA